MQARSWSYRCREAFPVGQRHGMRNELLNCSGLGAKRAGCLRAPFSQGSLTLPRSPELQKGSNLSKGVAAMNCIARKEFSQISRRPNLSSGKHLNAWLERVT